jgi:site-specific recombinase XerD
MADGYFAHLRGHWALTAPTEARDGSRHLAAIRMMFDWLATGGILPFNPATAVRGPKHVAKRGKTPVLAPEEARQLLDSINVRSHAGLRDRALIGLWSTPSPGSGLPPR